MPLPSSDLSVASIGRGPVGDELPAAPRIAALFERTSGVASLVVVAMGLVVLFGWWRDVAVLKSVGPAFATMKANTALCFVLIGVALWLVHEPQSLSARRRLWSRVGVSAALVIGAASLFEDATRVNLGIDELFFHDASGRLGEAPGRMSPTSAANFVLLSVAILYLDAAGLRSRVARVCALVATSIGFLALIGYLYGADALHSPAWLEQFVAPAVHTAGALFLLGFGVLCSRTDRGFMRVVISNTIGGLALRRVGPVVILAPLLVARLSLSGHQAGLFGIAFAIGLLSMGNVAALLGLGWVGSLVLVRAERSRRAAERTLGANEAKLRLESRFRTLTDSLNDAVVSVDESGKIIGWNRAATLIFRYAADDVLGQPVTMLVAERDAERVTDYLGLASTQSAGDGSEGIDLQGRRRDETVFEGELSVSAWTSNEEMFVTCVFRDRPRAARALARSEARFQELVDNAPVGIFETDADGECVYVNPKWTRMAGMTSEAARGQGWAAALHPEDKAGAFAAWHAARAAGGSFVLRYRLVSSTGETIWVNGTAAPLRDHADEIVGYLGVLVDVTAEHQASEALAKSEANFRMLIERGPSGICVQRDGRLLYANPVLAKLVGYSEQELVGRSILDLVRYPEDRAAITRRLQDAKGGATLAPRVASYLRADGEEIFLEGAIVVVEFDGSPALLSVVTDVTERRRVEALREKAEEVLRASVVEKETLLMEIHHRVKNNLQVIASLINLQAGKVTDPSARMLFEDMRGRVVSIALLHERLYRADDLANIDMHQYLNDLVFDVERANRDERVAPSIEARAEGVFFDIHRAVPTGLIVNELVSNAFKHAFPIGSSRPPRILVGLSRRDGAMELVVEDNGVGMPHGVGDTTETLGVVLVSSLSEQLDGAAELCGAGDGSEGTRWVVRFPAPSEGVNAA